MTTHEHAIRIMIPVTAWQSTVLEAMRNDQLLLLKQNGETVSAPLWHEVLKRTAEQLVES
jgi:hypothetical protein